MNKGKRILKVTLKRMIDEDPDTSWLGKYSDTRTSELSIDRAHDLDCFANTGAEEQEDCPCIGDEWNRREYRYFNPSFNYVDKSGRALPENTPEEVRKYVRQDYERMESLNRGDWSFIGIKAEAEVWNADTQVVQRIHSGGLWGIESDSGEGYIEEVEQEELSNLKDELKAYGFSARAISKAFENVHYKDS